MLIKICRECLFYIKLSRCFVNLSQLNKIHCRMVSDYSPIIYKELLNGFPATLQNILPHIYDINIL